MRGIKYRGQFNELKLRGVIMIDRDNITSNEQVHQLLSVEDHNSVGINSITKHFATLVRIMSEILNFTIDYRVTRSWAGRLGNTTYRLGLMGIVQRNEADVAASPSFLRISRLIDMDFYHESWDFDTGFLYLYSNLVKKNTGGGDFLAPFSMQVWIISTFAIIIIALFWKFFERFSQNIAILKNEDQNMIIGNIWFHTLAAVCQQGFDPAPRTTATRIVAFTLILFSLLMFNYYTSSVVGGLLSNNDPGVKNLDELVNSRLMLYFEDIGYNKVAMTEITSREIILKIRKKFYSQPHSSNGLAGFITRQQALPFIKAGTHAFHCELLQIYNEIAKEFNAEEICNLRIVRGFFKHEKLAMVITKKSQYLEMFRQILIRANEVGVVAQDYKKIRTSRPECQGYLTVLPVPFSGVLNAFLILGGGMLASAIIMCIEIMVAKYQKQEF